MIVRNLNDKAVMETTYLAHGGAIAQMILDRRILKEIGFLAIATLEPGKKIEAHVDPMEEIYFVLSGSGERGVDDEKRKVGPGMRPFIVMPLAGFPVILTSCWAIVSSYSTVAPWACIWAKRIMNIRPETVVNFMRAIM